MNNQELIATLKRADACPKAIKWIGQRDLKTAWAECPRPDWMVWFLALMVDKPGWPTHKELVSIAVYCARRAYSFVKKDPDNVIIKCIEAVEAWIENPCEEIEQRVKTAAYAAYVAYAAARVAYAAACVAYAAAYAVYTATTHAAAYASNVANAVVHAAVNDAEHKAICNYIRQMANIPI